MPNRSFFEIRNGQAVFPEYILYLNISRSPKDAANGLLYILERPELEAFDRREWIYDRIPITSDLEGVDIVGGEAYVYVAKKEWRLPPNATKPRVGLRRSYLDMIAQGLANLGGSFRTLYDCSTDAVPEHLVFADVKHESTNPLLADTQST